MRTQECRVKLKWVVENCEKEMDIETIREVEKAVDFCEKEPAFAGFSTRSLRPLITEQDSEIQQKVIAAVESAGNLKQHDFGTERKMKAAIDRFHDTDAHTPEPKHQNKSDFMEECTAFWVKARKYWSEEVIEEVLDKARVNTR